MGTEKGGDVEAVGIPVEPLGSWACARDRWSRGDLDGAMGRVGRNEAPHLLFELWTQELVTLDQLRAVLLHVWSIAEFPCFAFGYPLASSRQQWLKWFELAGFLAETGRAAPTEAVEVWRSQVGRVWGLSWATERSQGVWFHERNRSRGLASRLVHGFARPRHVLAMCDDPKVGRDEAEIIVRPGGVQIVEEVE